MKAYDDFISCSSKDRNFAARLRKRFESWFVRVDPKARDGRRRLDIAIGYADMHCNLDSQNGRLANCFLTTLQ